MVCWSHSGAAEGLALAHVVQRELAAPAGSGPPPSRPGRCARSGSSSSPSRSPCPPRPAGWRRGCARCRAPARRCRRTASRSSSARGRRVKPGVPFSTMNIDMSRLPGPVLAAMKYRSAWTPLVMNILVPLSTQSSPSRLARGADARHVGAGARLGDAHGGDQLAGDHAAQVLVLLRRVARVVQVRAGHVGVDQHGDDEAGEGGLRQRLGEHQVGQRVGARAPPYSPRTSGRAGRPAPMRRSTSRGTKPCSSQASACGSTSLRDEARDLVAQQLVFGVCRRWSWSSASG